MNGRTSGIIILTFLCFLGTGHAAAGAEELTKKVPVRVKADKLDYDRGADVYIAVGNVRIEQEGIVLEANRLVLDNKTGQATAEGKVYLQEKGDILRAERLEININTRAGMIYNGELFIVKDKYRLTGAKIEKRSDTVYRLEQGTFTTCDEDDWYLKAKEINVDMDRYATGRGVSFRMAGLPLFYTPYLLFPVRRQTGLLIPEVGYSSSEGFLMKNSFFWAVSDSRDLTLYSDYRRGLGHGTGIEYRYINSRESLGNAFFNYFDSSEPEKTQWRSLWEFTAQHQEEIADDLSARVDINLVSDHIYYRVLEKKLELRSKPYLDSNAFYVERWDTAALHLMGQYSTDLTKTNDKTIQKLPELRYTIFQEPVLGPAYLSFEGSAVNFSVREGYGAQRADFNPRLTVALRSAGLSLTPRIGLRAAYYDRSANDPAEPTALKYVYAGGDITTRLSRVFGSDAAEGIGRVRHSIEPKISYDYIPRVDTNNIPQFDALDVVDQRNLFTFSLINRLTAQYREGRKTRNFDMMILRIAQSYDVMEARNGDPATATPRSEIQGEVVLKTPHVLTVAVNGNYNTYIDRRMSSSESVTINTAAIQFDASHRYLRDPRTQFIIGGIGFKLAGWNIRAGVWHDLENKTTTQEEYRANLLSQCWGLGISYISKPGETRYLLMLELKGLGALKF